jgi:hypothetical protein
MESKIDDFFKSIKMTYVVCGAIATGIFFAVKVLTHSEIVDNRLNSTKKKVEDLSIRVMELEKEVSYQRGIEKGKKISKN